MNKISLLLISCALFFAGNLSGSLAGGRPNSISGGINSFAGVSNPANAVWIPDRFDVGCFAVYQSSHITNHDNNPLFNPGRIDTSYHKHYLVNYDAAITKRYKWGSGEGSIGFATYSLPTRVAVQTKDPVPIAGTTPILRTNDTQSFSAIFSLKVAESHSVGVSIDYHELSHIRNGNQRADNPIRSVSPGHVTNNGKDHSRGAGISLGWRWRVNPKVDFGLAWIKKSYVGQFRKYRGFEPHHAKNYIPQTIGAGIGYRPTNKIAGRLEVLWINLSNVPGANVTVLSDGTLNPNKRGSSKSPGPGLQDATLINMGVGYAWSKEISFGIGYSHRIRPVRDSHNFLKRPYRAATIYDLLTLGGTARFGKQEIFLGITHGFKSKTHGEMPEALQGGKFSSERVTTSVSFSWGYIWGK